MHKFMMKWESQCLRVFSMANSSFAENRQLTAYQILTFVRTYDIILT